MKPVTVYMLNKINWKQIPHAIILVLITLLNLLCFSLSLLCYYYYPYVLLDTMDGKEIAQSRLREDYIFSLIILLYLVFTYLNRQCSGSDAMQLRALAYISSLLCGPFLFL